MNDNAVQEPVQQQAPIDIASMMAREGVKTDESPVVIPAQDKAFVQDEAPKVEPPTEQPKADTATAAPVVPAVDATPKTAPAPPPVQQPPAAQPQQTEDWRELLKKQSEVDVLKTLGLDEKMINFLSKWRGGEDLTDYLRAVTVDYSKMNPEQLLRQQLLADFGSLSPEDFEEVYKMKVIEQYKLDPDLFSETEVRRGKLLLGIDAEKIRQDLMRKQQDLLFAKAPEQGPSAADLAAKEQQEQNEKNLLTYKNFVDTSDYTKELLNTRFLKIGDGDKAFNLEVANPNEVLDLLYDPTKWASKLWNEDGTPNVRKQLMLGAIAYDETQFISNLSKHYEMLGAKSVAEKIQNATPPEPGAFSKGDVDNNNPISQLARFGIITSGD
jgi:hypothetical protein